MCRRVLSCLAPWIPQRPLLSLPYIGRIPGIRWYHNNDTAFSPRPRLLKTQLPSPAARGRIATEIDCALPNLLWNPAIQLLAIEASHAADGHQGTRLRAPRRGSKINTTLHHWILHAR
ncbi:hypothetical protein EJ02DRAFT_455322 [Clathrospora elynae]|uniref:Uncharacterized protein n=1 Tax=Clathrospora elynae TaxID=706981 RepID=A0A6A5SN80_9PLEO|nr:hypothetical protein EJ02DRAFT_455322 [Clathrospora elynae]